MKTLSAIVLLLLVALTVGLAAPLLASPGDCVEETCAEDDCVDCCDVDCPFCLCCSHATPTLLSELDRRAGSAPDGWLGAETSTLLPDVLPRDILHVPRSAPLS